MKKIITILLVLSMACFAKGGLGTLIGVGVGAVAGKTADAQLKAQLNDAISKTTYARGNTEAGFLLTSTFITFRFGDSTKTRTIINPDDSLVLWNLIHDLNTSEAFGRTAWSDYDHNVIMCVADTNDCFALSIFAKKNDFIKVGFTYDIDEGYTYIVSYKSADPTWVDNVWWWIKSHIIFVAIIFFGLVGFVIDRVKNHVKNKAS